MRRRYKKNQLRRMDKYLIAKVSGNISNNKIDGIIKFFKKNKGTIVIAEIYGLPNKNRNNFFAFHIHNGGECVEDKEGSYISALSHFDLEENKHPNHSGDLPMLYSNDGYAYMVFYTNRFSIDDIIGKTIIIHELEDDLKTDPAGNSGERIACGIIKEGN